MNTIKFNKKNVKMVAHRGVSGLERENTNAAFVAAALAPASVLSVSKMDEGDKAFRVIVNDDQLSLAIGKEGQNARLAAKLTGCKIDITGDPYVESEWETVSSEDNAEA